MAQSAEDKAKAKAEAALKKAAIKEAKGHMSDATNLFDALNAKIQNKDIQVSEEEIIEQSKKGLASISKAIESGLIEEKNLGEAYKVSESLALNIHNISVARAAGQTPFDTVQFLPNLITMTDGIYNELKYTKVVKGETGNEKYLEQKKEALKKSKVFFIYAAQFESECQRYDNAMKAYDFAMDYDNKYGSVIKKAECPIEDNQIAYYAYFAAHDAKNFEAMDKYYPTAVTFEKGAEGVKQLVAYKYLEVGDTARWADKVKKQCLEAPAEHVEDIQRLLGFFQSKGTDKMIAFADEVLAVAPEMKIANYGKGFALFHMKNYEEALKYFEACIKIDETYYDAWYQAGLCKYREAGDLNSTIDGMKDQVKAKKTKEQTVKLFGEAIPFFEGARNCAPDDPNKWAYELKICYKAVGNNAKSVEMDKLL